MTVPPSYSLVGRRAGSHGAFKRLGMHKGNGKLYWAGTRYGKLLAKRGRLSLAFVAADWPALVERARSQGFSIKPVARDPWPHLAGDRDCNKAVLNALEVAARTLSDVHDEFITIDIRSGRRTMAEQTELFATNMHRVDGRWVPKPGRPLTAVPDANAPHVRGVAADCGIEGRDLGDFLGARDACDEAGLGFPVPGEDWHVEISESFIGLA